VLQSQVDLLMVAEAYVPLLAAISNFACLRQVKKYYLPRRKSPKLA